MIKKTQRNIIIHYHLFKNAGTSFDFALSRVFGEKKNFLAHVDDQALIAGGQQYLENFLDEREAVSAFSSHELRFMAKASSKFKFFPATFIRCPILRSKSVYLFEKAQVDVITPGSVKAKEAKHFGDFVRWYLDESPHKTITNFQTRKCSFIPYDVQDSKVHLESTKRNLENYFNFGIVEEFDVSIKYFNKLFFPKITPNLLLTPWMNRTQVSDDNTKTLEQRREEVLLEMGTVSEKFIVENKSDLELYEYAVGLFHQNIRMNESLKCI
jgi:hypothetical protein